MNFTEDTFCTMPWSTIQISPSGEYRICCFSGAKFELNEDGHPKLLSKDTHISQSYNVLTHSIKEGMNDNHHRIIRLAQSKNIKHPSCQTCWLLEDAQKKMNQEDLQSLRYSRKNQYKNDGIVKLEDAPNVLNKDGTIDPIVRHMDFRFDNLCNMKCIMCDPMNSSLWYGDHVELTGQDYFYDGLKKFNIKKINGIYKSDYPDWKKSPVFWQRMDEIKDTLRSIYLNGGEPFVSPFLPEFLQYFIDAGVSENIRLDTDTNLSIINDKYLSMLKKFHSVRFSISCDDVDDRYNLIRFPGNYNIFKKNYEILKSSKIEHNIRFNKMTSCIGIHNVFAPIRLYQEFSDYIERFSIRVLRNPIEYDLKYLSKNMKLDILNLYEKSNIPYQNKTVVMGYLQNNLDIEDINIVNKFVIRMDKLDNMRKTDWKKTFSEVHDLLKIHYPKMGL